MTEAKPFNIPKRLVYEAWKQVKRNRGAPGIDGQSIEVFEEGLTNNLYKLWNRMSSGSYTPPAVKLCKIPKSDGGERTLGIPTVADRVAQMVVKRVLEPQIEPHFHPDSYGYRPKQSAQKAVGVARERCWKKDWVIDLDIKGFFDSIDHDLMMKAVKKHTKEKWILLYIERWLKAPAKGEEGELRERQRGTPQGGVISPLLANLFLHYAFDRWMQKHFPALTFERYADDIIVHCSQEKEASHVLEEIRQRLQSCGLELHPTKTKIVYCKDGQRRGEAEHTKFDFLGYEYRGRSTRNQKVGNRFVGFTPAVSPRAQRAMREKIRSWQLKKWTPKTLEEIAAWINPQVRGWMKYYGAYCKSALSSVLRQVELTIARWVIRKYKSMRRKLVAATRWLAAIRRRNPTLFAHWNR